MRPLEVSVNMKALLSLLAVFLFEAEHDVPVLEVMQWAFV